MKKTYRHLIVALLVSILMPLCITRTIAKEALVVSADDQNARAGESVVIPIRIEGNCGVTSVSIVIEFDSSVLHLKEIRDLVLFSGAMHTTTYASPYYLTWENDNKAYNNTQNGVIVELVFEISEDAVPGAYQLSISTPLEGILDCTGNEVNASFSRGVINVEQECEHTWGAWIKSGNSKHKRVCDHCAEVEYNRHDWDNGIVTEEPTEDDVGIKVYTCEICAGTKSEVIPALSDGEDDGELTVSATGKKVSGGASVTLELSNTGKDAESCRIAVTAFNSTGRMLDVEIANLTINGEASLSKTLSLTTSETISKVKLFYLDDRWVPTGDVQFITLK